MSLIATGRRNHLHGANTHFERPKFEHATPNFAIQSPNNPGPRTADASRGAVVDGREAGAEAWENNEYSVVSHRLVGWRLRFSIIITDRTVLLVAARERSRRRLHAGKGLMIVLDTLLIAFLGQWQGPGAFDEGDEIGRWKVQVAEGVGVDIDVVVVAGDPRFGSDEKEQAPPSPRNDLGNHEAWFLTAESSAADSILGTQY